MESQRPREHPMVVVADDGGCAQCGTRPGWYKEYGGHVRVHKKCLCEASLWFKNSQENIHRLGSQYDDPDVRGR